MDYNEQHERKLYESIKKQITVEKGFAKILVLEDGLDEAKSFVSNELGILSKKVSKLLRAKKPYAALDHLDDELVYAFNGKFFMIEENLTKNMILKFNDKMMLSCTEKDILCDLSRLNLALRNPKAA